MDAKENSPMDAIGSLFGNFGAFDYIGEPVTQQEHMLQCAHFARQHYPDAPEMQVACLLHDTGHMLGLRAAAHFEGNAEGKAEGKEEGKAEGKEEELKSSRDLGYGGGGGKTLQKEAPEVRALLDAITRQAWEERCSSSTKCGKNYVSSKNSAGAKSPAVPMVERMGRAGIAGHERLSQLFCDRVGLPLAVGLLAREHVNAKRYLCAFDAKHSAKLSSASVTTLGYQGGVMGVAEARAYERKYNVDFAEVVLNSRRGGGNNSSGDSEKNNSDISFDFEASHMAGLEEEVEKEEEAESSSKCGGERLSGSKKKMRTSSSGGVTEGVTATEKSGSGSCSAAEKTLSGPRPGSLLEAIVRMRRMDELGKCRGLQVGALESWAPVVGRLVASQMFLGGKAAAAEKGPGGGGEEEELAGAKKKRKTTE